ncbi:NAD-P-binding protein [Cylindrobasidium torrendii FP15055 ss-10]|uniref:NAD-P-binding protein n=1 Tax=Cylindrobasidium torrendii FP15055 ss-10 TaxID=1314674 RepID=A0A0D7BVA8_9AGAR|nr:NAD-P-binding protein [Cylindrobasidium torrendii FP15055 ss-10]
MSTLTVLSTADVDKVASLLTVDDLVQITRTVFAPPANSGEAPACPSRISINAPNHTALFMPARLPASSALGGTAAKIVSVTSHIGLPASTLLFTEDGQLEAVINARKLTALRNAAASLVSAQQLYPGEPRCIVAFGAGEQIHAHLSVFCRAYKTITRCIIVARASSSRASRLTKDLTESFPTVEFLWHHQEIPVDAILAEADVVVCATPSTEPLFTDIPVSSPPKPKHVVLIGSYKPTMHEIPAELVHRAHTVCVDDVEACLIEAGELIDAGLSEKDVVGLGTVILTSSPSSSQCAAGEFTIFKSVGTGLQDVAIARAVYNKAKQLGLGSVIPSYD